MVSVPLHLGNCITYALLVSICKAWDKTCQSIYRNLVINDDEDPVFFRVFLYPVIFVSICICICNCAVLSQLSEVCMWRAGNLQREIGPTQLQPSSNLSLLHPSAQFLFQEYFYNSAQSPTPPFRFAYDETFNFSCHWSSAIKEDLS